MRPHWGPGARGWVGATGCSRILPPWGAAPTGIPLRPTNPSTVLGQRLADRPRANVDRGEDDEDQEQEKGGCCGDRGDELHLQRQLPQPTLAGPRRALRCHGNWPPRNPARVTRRSTRADPAPTAGRRAALPPRPHRPRRTSRNRTAERGANWKRSESESVTWSRRSEPTPGGCGVAGPSFPAAPSRQPVRGATGAAETRWRVGAGSPQLGVSEAPGGRFGRTAPNGGGVFLLALARRLSQGRREHERIFTRRPGHGNLSRARRLSRAGT